MGSALGLAFLAAAAAAVADEKPRLVLDAPRVKMLLPITLRLVRRDETVVKGVIDVRIH